MRTLTCSVFKERRISERNSARSFFCLLFGARKRADDLSLHSLGSEKADFTPPFSKVFEVCANAYKLTFVKCAISRRFRTVYSRY